jgi:hypothetical protein
MKYLPMSRRDMKDIFMSCLQPTGELMMSQLMKAREAKLTIKVCQTAAYGPS